MRRRLLLFAIVVFGLVFCITFAASTYRQPVPKEPVITFDEHWGGAEALLAFDGWPLTRMVKTVAIKPDEELVAVTPEPEVYKKQPKPSKDICRGKGRVYHNGGRSWRCRR